MKNDDRLIGIDLIKTFAVACVVMIHVSAGFASDAGMIGTAQHALSVVWRCLCGAAVPLFFMCSGALMLRAEKELSIKKLYLRNVLRLIVAMLVWATFYRLWNLLVSGEMSVQGIVHALKDVVLFRHEFHLYYIHIMLLVYAFLPVTRAFTDSASERLVRYFLLIWFLTGILYPTLKPYWPFNLVRGFPEQWAMNMSYSAIGYTVLGHYLRSRRPSAALGGVLTLGGFAAILLPTLLVTNARGELFMDCLGGMSAPMCVFAAGLFILGLRAGDGLKKARGFVAYMSKASFCIYLVHVFVMRVLMHYGAHTLLAPVLSIPAMTLAIVAISTAAYWVISRIPVLRRWII